MKLSEGNYIPDFNTDKIQSKMLEKGQFSKTQRKYPKVKPLKINKIRSRKQGAPKEPKEVKEVKTCGTSISRAFGA